MKTARKRDHRVRVGRERSARTETRILEAALRVFANMGPDAPKIDDFVRAADIARGTFYNHFESVEELLDATSEWTTREVTHSIERAIDDLDGPALRLGVGLRLFFARAERDPVWCRFVERVWKLGGIELPTRDIANGIASGIFRAPSAQAARDLLLGGIREALAHIGTGHAKPKYGDQIVELYLTALGTEPRRIAVVLKHELPNLEDKEKSS